MARHRRLERAAVAPDTLDQHPLDLRIAPATDTRRRVRRDVARHRGPPGVAEFKTAPAEPACVVLHAVRPARMAFHAMRDGGEIEAALDPIAQSLVRHRLFS